MFGTYFIEPIYNVFVFLIGVMPGGDVGLAIIAITIITRIILYPVFASSIRMQMGMQAMQGELEEVTARYKDKPEELTRARIELLRKHKVNPLAGIFSLVIQIVVFIALYYAMFHEGFPDIAENLLYSFVSVPAAVNTNFLGFVDLLAPHNVVLAVLVALTQYAAIRFTISRTSAGQGGLTAEKAAQMRMQNNLMLYFMPVLLLVLGYVFPAAVALYFVAGNILLLGQEWLIRQELKAKAA